MAVATFNAVDFVVESALAESGRRAKNARVPASALAGVAKNAGPVSAREWTSEEDAFLRANLGYMTDAEIAKALGRTAVGVHIHWDRDMNLGGPSKAADIITANLAAEVLGVDAHKLTCWCDAGLIKFRFMAGKRKIRLIDRVAFRRWVLNPMNWVYFDINRIQDEELKRMALKRAQRWGDEWWSTTQVAKYHGVEVGDVKRYLKFATITGYRLPVSLGGRHQDRKWSYWRILKSEATRPDLKFIRRGDDQSSFTARGDAWILKAVAQKIPLSVIGRMMGGRKTKGYTGTTILYRWRKLTGKQNTPSRKP